jgi:hypothetical protein
MKSLIVNGGLASPVLQIVLGLLNNPGTYVRRLPSFKQLQKNHNSHKQHFRSQKGRHKLSQAAFTQKSQNVARLAHYSTYRSTIVRLCHAGYFTMFGT